MPSQSGPFVSAHTTLARAYYYVIHLSQCLWQALRKMSLPCDDCEPMRALSSPSTQLFIVTPKQEPCDGSSKKLRYTSHIIVNLRKWVLFNHKAMMLMHTYILTNSLLILTNWFWNLITQTTKAISVNMHSSYHAK